MYERVEVWKRIRANVVVRFQCWRRLADGLFAVQSADFLWSATYRDALRASDQQRVELLLEEDPADRCKWFPTLAEAISEHERYFDDMPGQV